MGKRLRRRTCCTVQDRRGCARVVEAVRVNRAVVHGREELVVVYVALVVEVDLVVVEDFLKRLLPSGEGFGAGRGVPRAVEADDDPRRLSAVDLGEVVLEPVDLLVRRAEGSVDILDAVDERERSGEDCGGRRGARLTGP